MLNKINYSIVSILFLSILSAPVEAQNPVWAYATESEGLETEIATLTSEDPDGNVFVAGYFQGDFSYAGQSFEFSGNANEGSVGDYFLSKISPEGSTLWSMTIANANTQQSSIDGLAVDSDGNAYICGILQPAMPGTVIDVAGFELTVNPPNMMYICKIDTDGNGLWIKTYTANGPIFLIVANPTLQVDSNDDVILGGAFTGTIDFDGTTLSVTGMQFDLFTSKYDSDGNVLWAQQFGSQNGEQRLTLNMASDDGILLGSAWSGDSLFLGDLFVVNDAPIIDDNFDRWIGKLNSDGEAVFLSREVVGGSADFSTMPSAIAAAPNGGGMFLSAVNEPINIGGEEITENGMLITKYSFEGALGSVEFIADLTPSRTIIPDGNGNYFYGGTFTTPEITIASDVYTNAGGASGTRDAIVIHCNANGEADYSLKFGDVEDEGVTQLLMMPNGQLQVAGYYNSSSLDLVDITLENTGFLTYDFFLGYLDFTSGIGDVAAIQKLMIYPNPSNSIVTIDLQDLSKGKTTLRIYNNIGQEVHAEDVSGQMNCQLAIASFGSGIYLVELMNNDMRYAGKILVE